MVIDISKITLENIDKYNKNKIRRCPVCNKEFEITYRKQECCSKKCYYKNNRKLKKEKQHDKRARRRTRNVQRRKRNIKYKISRLYKTKIRKNGGILK